MEEDRHIKGLEFLSEDYDPSSLKKLELVASMNHYRRSAVANMSFTKEGLLNKYREEIVANRRELLIEWSEAVEPSGRNIESAGSLTRRGRKAAKEPKEEAEPKEELKTAPLRPLDVSLSPVGPRTRSRSRSRSPERSPLRQTRPRKPVEAIVEEADEAAMVDEPAAAPALAVPAAEELLKSPRKRKSRKAEAEAKEEVKAEVKAEPKEAKSKSPKKKTAKEKEPKAKEPKEKDHKEKRASDAETSFSTENIFQSGSTAGFKRKRDSDEGDRASRRASRKDVAPHKHKHAAPAQSLPENAREVFEHAPDLQAPANLSHEPFDVSYGEPAAADFVDQVLQLPGEELGEQLGERLGELGEQLEARLASTPQRRAFLPSISEISSKVSEVSSAADEFAAQMNELATPEVPDSQLEREADEHKRELQESLERAKEHAETWLSGVRGKVEESVSGAVGAVSGAGRAVGGAVSGAGRAVGHTASSAAHTASHTASSAAHGVSSHYASWLATLGRYALLLLKIASATFATLFSGALIASGVYLLYWVRTQKLQQGYCVGEPVPISYPEFLYAPTLRELEPAQNWALTVFEGVAPGCTPCPAHAVCSAEQAQCTETRVRSYPLSSWLGLDPLRFECVEDPQKVRWLGELKRRAVIILNNQRAAHECSSAPTAELTEEQLRRELYARRAHGVDDRNFDELFERVRADLVQGDPQYPEVSVRQVPVDIEAQLTQHPEEGHEAPKDQIRALFSSSSLASVSMTCRLRVRGRTWIREHRALLRKIVNAAGPLVVLLVAAWRHRARRQRINAKYAEFIEVIRQVREQADADPTGTLCDYVLEHTLLGQVADKNERLELTQMIERNPNVRVRQLEKDCEVVRVWEWSA